jgi:hypothetical protein
MLSRSETSSARGVRNAIAAAALATWSVYRPACASSSRFAFSRHTTNAQRCSFIELGARAAAATIRSRSSGEIARSSNTRTFRRVLIASQVSIRE